MLGSGTILGAVDERLRMLDAGADRERLLQQGDAFVKQRFKRVACAVSDSEDDRFCGQLLFALCVLIANGGDLPILMENTGQTRTETHLAARFQNAHAHRFDYAAELVCADMRFGIDEDILRRTETDEGSQNMFAARVFCAGIELAVGECACAAFTKLHV